MRYFFHSESHNINSWLPEPLNLLAFAPLIKEGESDLLIDVMAFEVINEFFRFGPEFFLSNINDLLINRIGYTTQYDMT